MAGLTGLRAPGTLLILTAAWCTAPRILCYVFSGRLDVIHKPVGSRAGSSGHGGEARTARSAVMEPPTREAPPTTAGDQKEKTSSWAECIIEECGQAFLNIRNVKPQGFLPYHGSNSFNTTVMCRERMVDVSLSCAECVRLIIGGPYGARGVAVGAYPPEQSVLPCLELSKFLPRTKPKSHERWDGNQETPRQTAFCNVLNIGMR